MSTGRHIGDVSFLAVVRSLTRLFHYKECLVLQQSVADSCAAEGLACGPPLERVDVEADRAQAVLIVVGVDPHVVFLAEDALAVCLAGDAGVFEGCRESLRQRYLQDGPAAGLEHTVELAHGLAVVDDVLQDVVADDGVEVSIRITDGGDVHPDHHIAPGDVRGEVVQLLQLPELLG